MSSVVATIRIAGSKGQEKVESLKMRRITYSCSAVMVKHSRRIRLKNGTTSCRRLNTSVSIAKKPKKSLPGQ